MARELGGAPSLPEVQDAIEFHFSLVFDYSHKTAEV